MVQVEKRLLCPKPHLIHYFVVVSEFLVIELLCTQSFPQCNVSIVRSHRVITLIQIINIPVKIGHTQTHTVNLLYIMSFSLLVERKGKK